MYNITDITVMLSYYYNYSTTKHYHMSINIHCMFFNIGIDCLKGEQSTITVSIVKDSSNPSSGNAG